MLNPDGRMILSDRNLEDLQNKSDLKIQEMKLTSWSERWEYMQMDGKWQVTITPH